MGYRYRERGSGGRASAALLVAAYVAVAIVAPVSHAFEHADAAAEGPRSSEVASIPIPGPAPDHQGQGGQADLDCLPCVLLSIAGDTPHPVPGLAHETGSVRITEASALPALSRAPGVTRTRGPPAV